MKTAFRVLLSLFICAAVALGAFVLPARADMYLPGDANGDGDWRGDDARTILRYVLGLETDDSVWCPQALDADGDGSVTVNDAYLTLRAAFGLDDGSGFAAGATNLFSYTAPQTEKPEAKIAMKRTEANGSWTVDLIAENCTGLNAAMLVLEYDPAVLKVRSTTPGTDIAIINAYMSNNPALLSYKKDYAENQCAFALAIAQGLPDQAAYAADVDTPDAPEINDKAFQLATVRFSLLNADAAETTLRLKVISTGGIEVVSETVLRFAPVHVHNWRVDCNTTPTCGANGMFKRVCRTCDKREETIYPATGNHIWGEWRIDTPATYSYEGARVHKCTVCGLEKQEAIPKLAKSAAVNDEYAKEKGDILVVAPEISTLAGYVISRAGYDGKIIDKNGDTVHLLQPYSGGDTLIKGDGTRFTIAILGDPDGDGKVTANDARYALRTAVKLFDLRPWQAAACRVSGGSDITAADARAILRAAVKLDVLRPQ